MTIMRFAALLLLAVAIEMVVFRHVYRDLVYLLQSLPRIASDPRERLQEYGAKTLSRPHLGRKCLEALARAAWHTGDTTLYSQALERLARDYPDDQEVQLRRADSLRLTGHLDEAAAIYQGVLGRDAGRRAGRGLGGRSITLIQ